MSEYLVFRLPDNNTLVTSLGFAEQGLPGTSALFRLAAPVTIPAGVTPVNMTFTQVVLPDGTSATGIINGIFGTLSRSGETYTFVRVVPGLPSSVPVNAQFSVTADPRTRAVITANATIPTSGTVTLQISPLDLLPVGGAILGSIRDVMGSLANVGGNYVFTPKPYPGVAVAITGNQDIFVAGSQASVTLGTSNALSLEGQQLSLGSPDGIDFPVAIYDPKMRPNPSTEITWGLVDKNNRLTFGFRPNGGVFAPTMPFNSLVTDGAGNFYWNEQDSSGLWQIYKASATGVRTQLTQINDNWEPQISGSKIIFWSNRDGEATPYQMNASDGGEKMPLFLSRFIARDWNQIIVTGGINALGTTPAGSNVAVYNSLKFSVSGVGGATSINTEPTVTLTAPVALTEHGSETIGFATAALLRELAVVSGQSDFISLMSGAGINGVDVTIAQLKKGSISYTWTETQIQQGRAFAIAAGKTHVARAIIFNHGGADNLKANQFYDLDLIELQEAYEESARTITGQVEPMFLLIPQFSAWTVAALGNSATSLIPFAQVTATKRKPGKIFIPCPMYQFTYGANGYQLTVAGIRHMGEYCAKALEKIIVQGKQWKPLQPRTINRNGANILVDFDVPVSPLVWDTTTVTNPGNYGFEFWDNSGATPLIAAVAITAPTQVTVTLNSVPTGSLKRLRYAYTGTPGNLGGNTTGPRGNLADSDATASRFGFSLKNWCIHFDEICN